MPQGASAARQRDRYVLRGQVEDLGNDGDVDILVFPIGALGRGVNIVYRTNDQDRGRAAIGSVYFLTRPHPAAGDLSLLTSLLARDTIGFDREDHHDLSLQQVSERYQTQRYQLYKTVTNLLARPLSASRLDRGTRTVFAANLLVSILQTIGRGMRRGMPVQVYFVDSAWAPRSAEGQPETEYTSLLVQMRSILNRCLEDPDPDLCDVYEALYGVFAAAFNDITNLQLADDVSDGRGVDLFDPSTYTSEIDFDDPDLYLPAEEDLLGTDDPDAAAIEWTLAESDLDHNPARVIMPVHAISFPGDDDLEEDN
jgi:hypothetical protein